MFFFRLRKYNWVRVILFCVFSCSFYSQVHAQGLVVVKPSRDQAAVYAKPDFDAKIIYLLPKNKKVMATRSTTEGLNGLGLFHKVKLNSKTFGYVLDTEVQVVSGLKSSIKKKTNQKTFLKDSSKANKDKTQDLSLEPDEAGLFSNNSNLESENLDQKKTTKKKDNKKNNSKEDQSDQLYYGFDLARSKQLKNKGPLFFSTLVGGHLGFINYSEKIKTGTKSSNELVYGFKLSGSNIFFKNFLMDLTVSLHFGAPKFFNDFSNDPSGFFIITELNLPFILGKSSSSTIYAAIGPMLNASFFDFNISGKDESSQNIRLGGVGSLGIAYELGEYVVKIEPKYYFESSSYWGVLAGLQKRF